MRDLTIKTGDKKSGKEIILRRTLLAKQLKKESELVREESMKVLNEFEAIERKGWLSPNSFFT